MYAGLSAAGYVIYELPVGQVQIVSPSLLCVQILATVTAALYFVATGRCEANPAQTGDDSGRGGAAPANGAAKTETGKPAAEPAPAKPAAPLISAGRALFGGGDTQAGATAPALPAPLISAVAAPLATAAKASLFTGSSSGGRSKYGGFADDDRPEVNPFLTG